MNEDIQEPLSGRGRRAYHFCATAVNINRGLRKKKCRETIVNNVRAETEPADDRASPSVSTLELAWSTPLFQVRTYLPTASLLGDEQLA